MTLPQTNLCAYIKIEDFRACSEATDLQKSYL